jgi:hypothetical protein
MLDILSMLAVAGVAIGLMMAARRLEPHWVSKDQRRFICRARVIDDRGVAIGGGVNTGSRLPTTASLKGASVPCGVRVPGVWKSLANYPDPPARREIFLLTPETVNGTYLSLKLPASSKLVPKMRAAIEGASEHH